MLMTEAGGAVLSDFASSRIIRKATGRDGMQVRIIVHIPSSDITSHIIIHYSYIIHGAHFIAVMTYSPPL